MAQALVDELQCFATLARESDQYHHSQRLSQRLKFYHTRMALPGADSWLLEEARNHWANVQPELAIRMLETSMTMDGQSVKTRAQVSHWDNQVPTRVMFIPIPCCRLVPNLGRGLATCS